MEVNRQQSPNRVIMLPDNGQIVQATFFARGKNTAYSLLNKKSLLEKKTFLQPTTPFLYYDPLHIFLTCLIGYVFLNMIDSKNLDHLLRCVEFFVVDISFFA